MNSIILLKEISIILYDNDFMLPHKGEILILFLRYHLENLLDDERIHNVLRLLIMMIIPLDLWVVFDINNRIYYDDH